jgi:hypothetical protein
MLTSLAPDFAALAEETALAITQDITALPVTEEINETIYSTTDYDQFTLFPGNRAVDPKHVRKLVALISAENLLRDTPILVTVELAVLDGQHRLSAASELNIPIFYRISTLAEQHITTLNTAQKSWQGVDFLRRWTELGKPAYQALTEFMQRHPSISFSNAKTMVAGSADPAADEFRHGHYKVGDIGKADAVACLIERIKTEAAFKYATDSRFVAAIFYCVTELEGFESKVFMRKLLNNPTVLMRCATHEQYMKMLSGIYNYKTAKPNWVRFE